MFVRGRQRICSGWSRISLCVCAYVEVYQCVFLSVCMSICWREVCVWTMSMSVCNVYEETKNSCIHAYLTVCVCEANGPVCKQADR